MSWFLTQSRKLIISYLDIIIHLISMSYIKVPFRIVTRTINSRIHQPEGLVGSMQLASGTSSDRIHGIFLSRTWTEARTHVASKATSSMCERTRKCRWMTKRLTRHEYARDTGRRERSKRLEKGGGWGIRMRGTLKIERAGSTFPLGCRNIKVRLT